MAALPGSVAVIGAGIVGTMTALELQRRGHQVTLIDREGPAAGCSFGNGGAIGPNTCTPFAMPGMLRKIPKWYLDPDGPVTVSKAWAMKSGPWILRWLLNSREDRALKSSRAMQYLHGPNLEIYREVLGAARYADLFREEGHLYVYTSDAPSESERAGARFREILGLPSQSFEGAALHDFEPGLSKSFKRGVLMQGNAHTVSPSRLVTTIFDLFLEAGGTFRKAEVVEMKPEGGGLRGLRLSDGLLEAERYVLCLGIFSGSFAAQMGAKLPMVAERGYHVSFSGESGRLRTKVMNGSTGFGATQMENGLQLSGTVELASPEAEPDWRRTDAMMRKAAAMFAEPLPKEHTRWMGRRPSLPDSLPVIDRAPRASNVVLNFAHSHWGMNGAPGSSRLAADLVEGRTLPPEAGSYSAGRFAMA